MLQKIISFFKGWGIYATPEKDITALLNAVNGSSLFGYGPIAYTTSLDLYKALGGRAKQIPNIKELLPALVIELNKKPYPPVLDRCKAIPLASIKPWYDGEYPVLNSVFRISSTQMYVHLNAVGIDLNKIANYYGSTIVVTKSIIKKQNTL